MGGNAVASPNVGKGVGVWGLSFVDPAQPRNARVRSAWTDEHILKHSTEEQMRSAKAHWWRAPPGPPPEVDPPVRLMMYVSAERMKASLK
eukprot:365961-Chlamydomonas_euryale.AAC.10